MPLDEEKFGIAVTNFLPKYPNITDQDYPELNPYEDDFYQAIYNKKEFFDEKLEPYEAPPGRQGDLLKHQKFISKFLSGYTLYDGLLLFHEMGTGKGCSAIAAAEGLKSNPNFSGAIILAKGTNILENIKSEITFICTAGNYIPENYDDLNSMTRKVRLNKSLEQFYTFDTFVKFVKKIDTLSDEQIDSKYSNKIIIIDEAHNLRKKLTDEKGIKIYDSLHRFLHIINNKKVLLLSGTPMKDQPQEIAAILNLLLPLDRQMETKKQFEDKYLLKSDDGSVKLNPDEIEKLKSFFKGYVSYLKVPPPIASLEDNQNQVKKVFISKNIRNYNELSKFRVFPDYMSNFQSKVYLRFFQKNIKEGEDEDIYNESIYSDSRQSSLFVFPNGSHGKAGFDKYIKESKKVDQKDPHHILKSTFKITHDLISEIKADNHDEQLEKLKKYSSKYATTIDQILKAENKSCFVYCEMVKGSGAILFSQILKLFGFTESRGLDKTPKLRYAILTNTTTTAQDITNIKKLFNSKENMHGNIIKVLIGSKVVAEGLSFKNVQETHILTPYWNFSETDQVIYRTIRAFSHEDLIRSGLRDVTINIYLHASIPQDKGNYIPKDSVDLFMYKISEIKDLSIKSVERVLKESAVDCALNYDRNKRNPENFNQNRECDYQDCEYTCDGIDDLENADVIDFSTYQLYFSHEMIITLISIVQKLFKTHFFIKFQNILDLIPHNDVPITDYTTFMVLDSLNRIINDCIPIMNKYGLVSFLKEENNIYFLVQKIDSQSNFMDTYYNEFPSIKDSSTLSELNKLKNVDYLIEKILDINTREDNITKFSIRNQEIILELCLLARKKDSQKNTEFRNWVIDFYNKYWERLDDNTYISFLLWKDMNILRCLYNDESKWHDCKQDLIQNFTKKMEQKLGDVKGNKYGYYGMLNKKTTDKDKFKLFKIEEEVESDQRKKLRGRSCNPSWPKEKLLEIIYKLDKVEISDQILQKNRGDILKEIEANKPNVKFIKKFAEENDINLVDLSDEMLKRIFYYGIMKKDIICKTIYKFFEKNNLFV